MESLDQIMARLGLALRAARTQIQEGADKDHGLMDEEEEAVERIDQALMALESEMG